jgi:NAD(P)-dependent dehydrogenase (short-subunit alcohol dehydrogenase family)
MPTMNGKVALVTGGGGGIGRATALAFAKYGAKVAVADINTQEGNDTVRLVSEAGGEALFIEVDVSREMSVKEMVATTVAAYGRLDYAHNNAGIDGELAPLADQTSDSWNRIISINLSGVFYGMKYEIPVMLEQGGGAIVNTASVAGLKGFGSLAPYVASKHGVVGLTRAAVADYGTSGIRFNALCPGAINTPMVAGIIEAMPEMIDLVVGNTPMARMGEPSEMGEVVAWLCSDEASYVNGQAFAADGGITAI